MSVATAVSATLISHPPCRCCSMAIFLGGGGGRWCWRKKSTLILFIQKYYGCRQTLAKHCSTIMCLDVRKLRDFSEGPVDVCVLCPDENLTSKQTCLFFGVNFVFD